MTTFSDAGISFGIIPEERTEEVLKLIADHFYPDEPLTRSLGIKRHFLIDSIMGDVIKGGCCVMATNSEGEIIGVRLADVVERNQRSKKFMERALMSAIPKFAWVFRKKQLCRIMEAYKELARKLEFDVWTMFDELGCQKIQNDICVCTSKNGRVKGLGTELVKQGEALAKEKGCEYSLNLVTGLYSGIIFREKCNYIVMKEVIYAEFLDKKGDLYLNDTREHTSCFSCYKKL